MLSNESRMWVGLSAWLAAMSTIVAGSLAVGAHWSTIVVLLLIFTVPMGIALLVGFGAPSPTVAEVLYAVNSDSR